MHRRHTNDAERYESKVFISSTVYDLLDIRAEVEQLLRDMRLVPVLSGSATSGFQPLADQNSIETCLANLRQCDAMIIILCQRYGPSLAPAGFPDLSATHLEYREAKNLGKPIHMYVRDRLEGDYGIVRRIGKVIWSRSGCESSKTGSCLTCWVNTDNL